MGGVGKGRKGQGRAGQGATGLSRKEKGRTRCYCGVGSGWVAGWQGGVGGWGSGGREGGEDTERHHGAGQREGTYGWAMRALGQRRIRKKAGGKYD